MPRQGIPILRQTKGRFLMGYRFQFDVVLAQSDRFIEGAALTLQLSGEAIVFGTAIGILGALARTEGPRWLDWIVGAYVEVIRNTPLLVQVFLLFFGLPAVGVKFSATEAALFALTVNLGAYATEIIRAGIEAIPHTQFEAGLSLSLTRLQTFRHIIFMPALEIIYPALSAQFTLTLLASSIVSVVAANELTTVAQIIEGETFRSIEVYTITTLLYIAMALGLRSILALLGLVLFRRRRVVQPQVRMSGI